MNRVFFPFPGLVEIRTVDTGCVVIKGVASSQYLCMEANGKLYGSVSHLKLQNLWFDSFTCFNNLYTHTDHSLQSVQV